MSKLTWYVNRLKAMDIREVLWRLNQKSIQKKEKKHFLNRTVKVTHYFFNVNLSSLAFNENALGINFSNTQFNLYTNIFLLGGYEYTSYKKSWHAGFQTKSQWPLTFSYQLNYKQCDSIGDARTNWELNRHFQFALLAKSYYVSGETGYLNELQELFEDWNDKNPFLHGITWTSIMEVAIRSISWMYCLAFLRKKGGVEADLLKKIEIGIINMIDYISLHYSRFSSANNHLLVEMTAIGLAGYAFGNATWKKMSVDILTEELPKQNYEDGVNKELSLHYQTFVMEAYALLAHCIQEYGDKIPDSWCLMLEQMCRFVSHSMWNEQIACEFGDNDEGKILDLNGGTISHYNYVLQLCSLVIGKRFHSFEAINETINWLFSQKQIAALCNLPLYNNTNSICFKIGGNSFFRDKENRVLIGIDHAALGFGAIAAHGHADALSFQMFVDGNPIFIDPGTFIYHCNLDARNEFRKTKNHNTVCIDDKNQSEMLGAFLWGKKAQTSILKFSNTDDTDILEAYHNGYYPIVHQRKFIWNKVQRKLHLTDSFTHEKAWCCSFVLGVECDVKQRASSCLIYHRNVLVCELEVVTDVDTIRIEESYISIAYGIKQSCKVIRIYGNSTRLETSISVYIK